MNRLIASLVIFLQACSAPIPTGSSPNSIDDVVTLQVSQDTPPLSNPPKSSCSSALQLAEVAVDGRTLSAFKLFNSYPPTVHTLDPREATLGPPGAGQSILLSCLPEDSLQFSRLVDGTLVEGTPSHIYPLALWELPGHRFLATYVHQNYETEDGEGVVIEISGMIIDRHGTPVTPIQGLSSWYEYEDAIRIRDLHYANGALTTTEEIFSPTERNETGEPLGYFRELPPETIKEHGIRMLDPSLHK